MEKVKNDGQNFLTKINQLLGRNFLAVNIALLYVYSRIILYFVFRVKFNVKPLNFSVQYLDPALLQNELIQSIFYQHSQPPLFNLFIGGVLKLFNSEAGYTAFFHIVFLILGLAFTVSFYLLLTRMTKSRGIAFVLTLLFILSPASILYENLLFYSHPVMAILLVSALMLNLYLTNNRLRYLHLFFLLLGIICLIYSSFTILWFAAVLILLFYFRKSEIKKIFYAALLPLLVVFSLYMKNYILFGEFTNSTWLGMNISRITIYQLPEDVRNAMVQNKELSEVVRYGRFPDVSVLIKDKQINNIQTGIKALDQQIKSTNHVNFNNINYITISDIFLKDALHTVQTRPEVYVKGLTRSFFLSSFPAETYPLLKNNSGKITYLINFYQYCFFGKTAGGSYYIFLFIALPALTLYSIWRSIYYFRKKDVNIAAGVTYIYMTLTVLYISLIGNLFEFGENQRFRYIIDPFYLIIFGVILAEIKGILLMRKQKAGSKTC